jgi:putative transposase
LVRLSAVLSVADLVQGLKGASAFLVNSERLAADRFGWQDGYGAFSVCPTHVSRVVRYIERQKQHHAADSTVADWERDCTED